MPRHGGSMGNYDKSKDFKGSMLRLFKNLNKWCVVLIIALILAFSSAVLSTIAPNKLSSLTNIITDGLKPDTEKFQEISESIYSNTLKNYAMSSVGVSNEELVTNFNELSLDLKAQYITDITFEQTIINKEDQVQYFNIINTVDSSDTDATLSALDSLPKSIYDLVKPTMDMDAIKSVVFVLATIYVVSALFGYVQSFLMATVSNNFARKLRKDISVKINKLPLNYFDSHETGDVLSRVTNDVDSVAQNMNQSLASLISSITLFIGSVIMMFLTNAIMAITAIVASLLGFVFSFMLLKKSQKYFKQRQEQLGELNGHIEEIYSGHNVVKTYNGEEDALKEFDNINEKLYVCNQKSQFLSGIMQPLMGFVGDLGYVAVCVVGAVLVMKGYTSFGTIVAFMVYVRLFTSPLSQIAQALSSMQTIAAASARVFEFLDEKEMVDESHLKEYLDPKTVKGNIEFKHVKFGYDDKKMIINDFSAEAKSGQKIAIVGPTGAGKTTMVNLLMKFYDINGGDILIDGKSIKSLSRENIHDLFVMVLQDTWLFEGSIKDNIRFNNQNISDEEIWKCCDVVGVSHFIKTLPNGIDAILNDNDSISQGQKQLLTIARGMIKDAPFLILDEATSNVDTRTEELVQKAMDKLTVGRTSFIIAHRLSTIKNADLILVMNDGNIIEQGTHEQLLEKKGFYSKLYNSQFEQLT